MSAGHLRPKSAVLEAKVKQDLPALRRLMWRESVRLNAIWLAYRLELIGPVCPVFSGESAV